MEPENQVHGQFTYFQALIEDEYILFNFNDKCSLHLPVTEGALVQFYKEIDNDELEKWLGKEPIITDEEIPSKVELNQLTSEEINNAYLRGAQESEEV